MIILWLYNYASNMCYAYFILTKDTAEELNQNYALCDWSNSHNWSYI